MEAKITADQLDAEWQRLDRLVAETAPRIISSRGFTRRELQERQGWPEKRARLWIEARIADGTVRQIGIRPGHGGPGVYELTAPVAQ